MTANDYTPTDLLDEASFDNVSGLTAALHRAERT